MGVDVFMCVREGGRERERGEERERETDSEARETCDLVGIIIISKK